MGKSLQEKVTRQRKINIKKIQTITYAFHKSEILEGDQHCKIILANMLKR